MINYNSIRETILLTQDRLRKLSGSKKCVIKRYIKIQHDIFNPIQGKISMPKDSKIEIEVDCFITANPTLVLSSGSDNLGTEYKNKIYIRVDDIVNSDLKYLINTDEIQSSFESNQLKKYVIKDFAVLFDCLYMITIQ